MWVAKRRADQFAGLLLVREYDSEGREGLAYQVENTRYDYVASQGNSFE